MPPSPPFCNCPCHATARLSSLSRSRLNDETSSGVSPLRRIVLICIPCYPPAHTSPFSSECPSLKISESQKASETECNGELYAPLGVAAAVTAARCSS